MICQTCRDNTHECSDPGCLCQHNPELGAASRNANELLKLAETNAKLVNSCEHKDLHNKMDSCGSCPYGRAA